MYLLVGQQVGEVDLKVFDSVWSCDLNLMITVFITLLSAGWFVN